MPPSIPAIVYGFGRCFCRCVVFRWSHSSTGSDIDSLLFRLSLRLQKIPCLEEVNDQVIPLFRALRLALPVLLTPVIILGGILGRIFTPTEAAAAAVVWVLILCVFYRSLSFKSFNHVLVRTASTTGSILFIVAAAGLFGWVIAREQVTGSD